MTQGDLLADAAIRNAQINANDDWMRCAKQATWHIIRQGHEFTTDDIWQLLDDLGVRTHENRALGAVIRSARDAGVIVATGRYVKTRRPEAHSRPVMVWEPMLRVAS